MFVRGVTMEDADSLYTLVCKYRRKELPQDIFKGILKSALAQTRRRLVLALEEDVPVGFADMEVKLTLCDCALIAVINDFFVAEECRGKSIGTGMLISLTDQAKKVGCSHIQASCPRVSLKSQNFLERNGFIKSQHLFTRALLQPHAAAQ